MINFIRNKSCLPYYLLVYFLLRYYWPYRIYFLSTFISSFHFYDLNYDFISEIGIIIIIFLCCYLSNHPVPVSFSTIAMAPYYQRHGLLLLSVFYIVLTSLMIATIFLNCRFYC